MTRTDEVIERAMAFVAASRAARQRDLARRAEWQRRVQLSAPLPPLPRPVQLPLRLER